MGQLFYYPDSGNNNASLLKNTIPFDFDPSGGSYEYKLYKHGSSNTIINFGEGEWVLDTDTGILTFYHISGISGVGSSQPPKISFYKYIGTFGASSGGGGGGSGSAEKISEGHAKIECFENSGNNDFITFETSGDTSPHERMRIDKDGNVGIGTTTPFNKLDVNGTIKATGSLTDGITSLFHGSIIMILLHLKLLMSNATWQTIMKELKKY